MKKIKRIKANKKKLEDIPLTLEACAITLYTDFEQLLLHLNYLSKEKERSKNKLTSEILKLIALTDYEQEKIKKRIMHLFTFKNKII